MAGTGSTAPTVPSNDNTPIPPPLRPAPSELPPAIAVNPIPAQPIEQPMEEPAADPIPDRNTPDEDAMATNPSQPERQPETRPAIPQFSGSGNTTANNSNDVDSGAVEPETPKSEKPSSEIADAGNSTDTAQPGDSENSTVPKNWPMPRVANDTNANLSVIDSSAVTVVSNVVEGDWQNQTDQQLIDSIRMKGHVSWMGRVKLSPRLVPNPPNFHVVVGLENRSVLSAATSIGLVEFDEVVDESERTHLPLTQPPGVVNPTIDWVAAFSENYRRFTGTSSSVAVGVEFERPTQIPLAMDVVKGRLKLLLATRTRVLTLQDFSANQGRIQHPFLDEKGLEIIVRQPDAANLVVEIRGDSNLVKKVGIAGGTGVSNQFRRMSSQRITFFQYVVMNGISTGLDLDIELVESTRELTLPFLFKEMPMELAEAPVIGVPNSLENPSSR